MCRTSNLIDQAPSQQFNVPEGAEQGSGISIQQLEQICKLHCIFMQMQMELLRKETAELNSSMQQLAIKERHLAHQMDVLTGKDSPLQLNIWKSVCDVFSTLSELFARAWGSLPSVSNLFSA